MQHVNEVLKRTSFSVWLIVINIMSLDLSVLLQMTTLSLKKKRKSIPLYESIATFLFR